MVKITFMDTFRGGGEGKRGIYPRDNFILCHGMKIKSIKKHQKLNYSTELRLKTLKNCFNVVISIEFKYQMQ